MGILHQFFYLSQLLNLFFCQKFNKNSEQTYLNTESYMSYQHEIHKNAKRYLQEDKNENQSNSRDLFFQNWDEIQLSTNERLKNTITFNINQITQSNVNGKIININIANFSFPVTQKINKVDEQQFSICPNDKWKGNKHLKQQKKRFVKINTQYGLQLYIDQFDLYVSTRLKDNGVWQPSNLFMAIKWVKPGFKILNLGSHIGLQIVFLGKIIGDQGKIFVFEPYSVSNHLLRKNLQINGILHRAKTYRLAASNTLNKTDLHISYKNTGGNSIINLGWTKDIFKQKIQLVKVDDVLPQDIELDFALIDVQRVEANALMGMKKIIQRSPRLVMIVQWQTQFNISLAREILQFLIGKGYRMYKYQGRNQPCKLGIFTEIKTIDELLKITFIDVIFVPKNMQLPK